MRKTTKLTFFILISFLLPWAALCLQSRITNDNVNLLLFGVQAASPSIAAFAVLLLSKEVRSHFKLIFQKAQIIAVIVIPVLIASITMLISKTVYCIVWGEAFSLGNISATKWLILLWALVAEELGWRGYLEPFLREMKIKKWIIPCIVGFIWGLWHYHYFIQGRMDVPLLLFFVGCIIESYIYSILVSITRNVLSAMIYHFSWNLMLNLFLISPSDNGGSIIPYTLVIILETVGIIIYGLSRRYGLRGRG
ncbi:MAG: CPBP family intramembrane metalloprotease [Lachnospiraceae bacterium]|nr:CPBP family intramembrane metalloprotease [Lachnospiraceae bacterium]